MSGTKPDLNDVEMARDLGRIALQRKPRETILLDLRELCSFTDFMLILTGRSTRQVISLGEYILREAKNQGIKPLGREGLRQGQWVLLDFGPVVVHVFLEEVKDYYDLEGLWVDAVRHDWTETDQPPELGAPGKEA
jgi:ribosome-associated protein